MGDGLTFRSVRLSDVPVLQAWDREDHVAEATGDPIFNAFDWSDEIGKEVDWREMVIAETADRRPVGFVQMIDCREEETHYWGDGPENEWGLDIWLGDKADIGQGYGRQIMTYALSRCFDHHHAKTVLVDPLSNNQDAHRFYEALGFEFIGPRQFGPDHCHIYAMTKSVWQKKET